MTEETTYHLRYMTMADIPSVITIDAQSFPIPWSARSYVYEVTDSAYSHMVVVEQVSLVHPPNQLHAMWQRMTGRSMERNTLLAYGGLWRFNSNAHISTIASHPMHRRKGWGELAFLAMLRRAMTLSARRITLEVRVGNVGAQALYKKYGFVEQGIKKGYYHDNHEDAYDMGLELWQQRPRDFIENQYWLLCDKLQFDDTYTDSPRPTETLPS